MNTYVPPQNRRADHKYFVVAQAAPDQRALFIRRTYEHLAVGLFAFFGLETAILKSPIGNFLGGLLVSPHVWVAFFGLFVLISGFVYIWARPSRSAFNQNIAFAFYLCFAPLVLVPLLFRASSFASPDVIPLAGLAAVILLLALTITAFTTRGSFKYSTVILKIGGLVAAGLILTFGLFGLTLGFILVAGLIVCATARILAATGRIIHEYAPHQHAAAALTLLAAGAMLPLHSRLVPS